MLLLYIGDRNDLCSCHLHLLVYLFYSPCNVPQFQGTLGGIQHQNKEGENIGSS